MIVAPLLRDKLTDSFLLWFYGALLFCDVLINDFTVWCDKLLHTFSKVMTLAILTVMLKMLLLIQSWILVLKQYAGSWWILDHTWGIVVFSWYLDSRTWRLLFLLLWGRALFTSVTNTCRLKLWIIFRCFGYIYIAIAFLKQDWTNGVVTTVLCSFSTNRVWCTLSYWLHRRLVVCVVVGVLGCR